MNTGKECGETTTQEDCRPAVVITGSLLGGFKVYGPFDTVDEAANWCGLRSPFLGHCTVMPIEPPESCGINVMCCCPPA